MLNNFVSNSTVAKNRVNLDVLLKLTKIESLDELRKELRAQLAWRGKFYSATETTKYTVSTVSHLITVHPDLKVHKNHFIAPNKDTPQSLREFKEIDYKSLYPQPLYNHEPEIVKSGDNDDKYIVLLYDVEATPDGAFIGIKVKGFKYLTIPLTSFKKYLDAFKSFFPNKPFVCVAYNDIYDGFMVSLAHIHKPTTIGEAIKLSAFTMMAMTYSNSTKGDYLPATKNYLHHMTELDPMIVSIRNPLVNIFKCNSFDMFLDAYKSGSLKLNAYTRGLKWSETITSDLFQYNKEDLINTYKLFYEFEPEEGGGTPLQIMTALIRLYELSNVNLAKNPCTICSNLAVWIYQKNILSFDFTKNSYKVKKVIDAEIKRLQGGIERCKIESKKGDNVYRVVGKYGANTISLAAGDGGAHSLTEPIMYTDGGIYVIDFSSFYPNLFFSEYIKFFKKESLTLLRDIINKRIRLKKSKDTTDLSTARALKIFINSIYGILKKANRGGYMGFGSLIAMSGHIVIFKLVQYMLDNVNCYIIDLNTDGIIIKRHDESEKLDITKLSADIESYTGLEVSIEQYNWIVYKSCGNYLMKKDGESLIRKGSWLYSKSKPSLIYTDEIGNEHGYLIYNLANIISAHISGEALPKPKIYSLTKLKGITGVGQFTHQMIESLPFGFKDNAELTGSVVKKDIIDLKKMGESPEDLSLTLIKLKLSIFNNNA